VLPKKMGAGELTHTEDMISISSPTSGEQAANDGRIKQVIV
jgi:hypothetical protein